MPLNIWNNDEQKLIGMCLSDAISLLEKSNKTLRIVKMDGNFITVTRDFVQNRLNVSVEDGIITDIGEYG